MEEPLPFQAFDTYFEDPYRKDKVLDFKVLSKKGIFEINQALELLYI